METNPLVGSHPQLEGRVAWDDPQLSSITRLRLLSDAGFDRWDVSYCHGRLKNGTHVEVELPFSQLKRSFRGLMGQYVRHPSIAAQIVAFAIKDKVHAKTLGILDAISTLT